MARRKEKTRNKIPPIKELYGGGVTGRLMRGEYSHRKDIAEAIQRRHERGMALIDERGYWVQNGKEWRVPYGVREAFKATLVHAHVVSKYPFYVQWRHPNGDGTTRTLTRQCLSLGAACSFIATKVQKVDPDAFVVCKIGFYAPIPLLGKFPRRLKDGRMYYWCPRCMQPRRFRRRFPDETFYANRKFWDDEKGRYVWKNVKLALLECTCCGITNRDDKFRASNQPVEKIKLPPKGRARTARRQRRRR